MCLLAQSWHNGYLIAMKFVWYKCYKLSTIIAEAVLQFLVMSLSELFLCSLTCLCPVLCCYLCSRTQGLWERERESSCVKLCTKQQPDLFYEHRSTVVPASTSSLLTSIVYSVWLGGTAVYLVEQCTNVY